MGLSLLRAGAALVWGRETWYSTRSCSGLGGQATHPCKRAQSGTGWLSSPARNPGVRAETGVGGMMSGGAHRADCWVPWCPRFLPSRLGAPAQRSTKNPTRLIAQIVPGTKMGKHAPSGFPTLGTLSVAGKIENAKCSVFGMHSKRPSLILAIKVGGGGVGDQGRGDVRWLCRQSCLGGGESSSAFRCVGRPPSSPRPCGPSLLSAGPRR